ncbi:MAG: hypothetical protein ABI707_10925 [Ferruginibacter sp.]
MPFQILPNIRLHRGGTVRKKITEFFRFPPDGRLVSFTGIATWKIRDGTLAECPVERSTSELYKELTATRNKWYNRKYCNARLAYNCFNKMNIQRRLMGINQFVGNNPKNCILLKHIKNFRADA